MELLVMLHYQVVLRGAVGTRGTLLMYCRHVAVCWAGAQSSAAFWQVADQRGRPGRPYTLSPSALLVTCQPTA